MAITLGNLQGQAQVPDATKGKKTKVKIEHEGRENHEPLTPAHAAAEAQMEAADGESALPANKAFSDRGATLGPGTAPEPSAPAGPANYDRSYLEAGHAANSPQAAPPRTEVLHHGPPGIPVPLQVPGVTELAGHGGPVVQSIAAHQARAGIPRPASYDL
jgi:hypothetical protein